MKTLYLIGGTMGAGKTAVCQRLKKDLPNSVFLDGDWCWDANPFHVTEETKTMVIDNICYLLNNFIHCSSYKKILFAWVMHQRSVIDSILARLDTENCTVKCISLIADESSLRVRLSEDISKGIRTSDVIERILARIPMYQILDTIKIDTSGKTISQIADEIKAL